MNKVILIGRLTSEPKVATAGETKVARYSLAVDRPVRNGEKAADFISCVSFGKAAEFAEKYLAKGIKVAATGRIQTGSYTNRDGQKIYTTDVVTESLEFVERKAESGSSQQTSQPAPQNAQADSNGFMNIPDSDMDELPFN